jgi:hypothetical protein
MEKLEGLRQLMAHHDKQQQDKERDRSRFQLRTQEEQEELDARMAAAEASIRRLNALTVRYLLSISTTKSGCL